MWIELLVLKTAKLTTMGLGLAFNRTVAPSVCVCVCACVCRNGCSEVSAVDSQRVRVAVRPYDGDPKPAT